jgi:two-component system sensor histidine kinase DesK
MKVKDNGVICTGELNFKQGHGLQGMKERLEFVNGTLEISCSEGTTIGARIPLIMKRSDKEENA